MVRSGADVMSGCKSLAISSAALVVVETWNMDGFGEIVEEDKSELVHIKPSIDLMDASHNVMRMDIIAMFFLYIK